MTKWIIFDGPSEKFLVEEIDDPLAWIDAKCGSKQELSLLLETAMGIIESHIKTVVVEYKHEAGMTEEEKHTKGDVFEDWEITGFRLEVE